MAKTAALTTLSPFAFHPGRPIVVADLLAVNKQLNWQLGYCIQHTANGVFGYSGYGRSGAYSETPAQTFAIAFPNSTSWSTVAGFYVLNDTDVQTYKCWYTIQSQASGTVEVKFTLDGTDSSTASRTSGAGDDSAATSYITSTLARSSLSSPSTESVRYCAIKIRTNPASATGAYLSLVQFGSDPITSSWADPVDE